VARSIGARPGLATKLFAAFLTVLLTSFAGVASATTGGAPTPVGSPPPPGSPTGAPAADAPSAGALTVISAETSPRKSFYYGFRYPRLRFALRSTQPQNDIRVDVVDSTGLVVRTFYRNDVAPNATYGVRWDGTTAEGRPARNGRYSFRIGSQTGEPVVRPRRASASESPALSLNFDFYGYAFPVLGAHDFGDAAARFGAPRSGHTHQGQDTMAACGTPLVAARGGTVQYAGFEGNAGNYVVIDGKGTGLDFMYAHLAEPSPLRTGDPVRTGQPIGLVGDTGDATACHLHFEIWTAPGWYEGGSPIDPLPYLEKWDRYS
jgi:murein DD-endopeptidase MepM/ murein hydrolase activator NlpD